MNDDGAHTDDRTDPLDCHYRAMMPVRLHSPTQLPATRKSFDTRPRKVKRWAADLPIANPGETIRQVFYALVEVNRLKIDAEDRFAFLQAIKEPAATVTAVLGKTFIAKSAPSPGKGLNVAKLLRELQVELAHGYKILLTEALGSKERRQAVSVPQCVAAAMKHLCNVLVRSYQVYLPYPERIWRDLHTLYHLCEDRGSAPQDSEKSQGDARLLDEARLDYRSILLLALASPYRLKQGEAEIVHNALHRWKCPVHMPSPGEPGAKDALFCVDLGSDTPPTYRLLYAQHPGTQLRILDAAEILQVLKAETVKLGGADAASVVSGYGLTLDLAKRLAQSWGTLPQRSHKRASSSRTVTVAVGLDAVYHLARGRPQATATPKFAPASTQNLTIEPAGSGMGETRDHRRSDQWGMVVDRAAAATFSETLRKDAEEPNFPIYTCDTLDESPAGASLRSSGMPPAGLRIGELVGLQDKKAGGPWSIGIVRWLQMPGEGKVEFGLQLLGPEARPVLTRHMEQNLRTSDRTKALMIPASAELDQAPSLLTPTRPYRTGDLLVIQSGGREFRARLARLIDSSGTFHLYQFADMER